MVTSHANATRGRQTATDRHADPDGKSLTRLNVRAFASEDLSGVQALFHRAYGAELTTGQWEWKYGRSPFEHFGVVGEREGEIVAYYGGWRWRLHGGGRRRDALVFCDIMTDPSARMAGRLPPLIPLHEAAMELAASAGIPYFCGFPNRGAARFGSRFLGYRYEWMAACSAPLAPFAALSQPGSPAADGFVVDISDTFPEGLDELSARLHALPGFRVERTRDVLNWRYHARPDRYYRVYTARVAGGAPEAYAVASTAGSVVVLVDLQAGRPDTGEGLDAIFSAVARDLAPLGITELRVGLSRFSPLLPHLAGRFGFSVRSDENPFGILPTPVGLTVEVSPENFDTRWGDNDVF